MARTQPSPHSKIQLYTHLHGKNFSNFHYEYTDAMQLIITLEGTLQLYYNQRK